MRQFIEGSDAAWAELEAQCARSGVRFAAQEMPTDAEHPLADVGFKLDPLSGRVGLAVAPAMQYSGRSSEVAGWLRRGSKGFSSFAELRAWIVGDLASAFRPSGVANLTDLEAVRSELERPRAVAPEIDEAKLYARLSGAVRGQDPTVRTAARRVARHLARPHPRRPATLFAVGPTGVGKTRLAETLGEVCRAQSSASPCGYVRLDMSEYQEAHRVSQLLGAPQGYVGYQDGSHLVDALRTNPRSVVLFDEIEKAHPAILRALMNAMDAGRLSSAKGGQADRQIDCRQAIFIFTSNVESDAVLRELEHRDGFSDPRVVDEVCRQRLRASGIAPELIGRLSCFLAFQQLSMDAKAEVVAIAVESTASEYDLAIDWIEPGAIVSILEHVSDADFGARPYEYLVDELLGDAFMRAREEGARSVVVCAAPELGCAASVQAHGSNSCVRT